MKLHITSFAFLLSLYSMGQQLLPIQHDTIAEDHELILYGNALFGSTSVENALTNKFFYGGYIDTEIKNSSFDRHKGINRFGIDLSGELEYRNLKIDLLGNPNIGYSVKAGYYNYLTLLYPQDLFGLAFYGNERYLGENVDFSGSQMTGWSFQKIGFGLVDKRLGSSISLNLYSVSNYASARVKEGGLYQSIDGDSVNLLMDGQFEYASSKDFIKGVGLGIDLDFRIPVEIRPEQTAYFQVLVKNLGVAYMHTPITRYSADSVFSFNGLTFDQLYGDQAIFDANFSLMDTLGIDSTASSGFRMLPAFMQVGKIVDELNPKRIQGFYGIRLYPTVSAIPMVFAGIHYRTLNWLDMGLNVSYGGFTQFRAGMYSQIQLKNFTIGLLSEDLFGIISKKAKGQSFAIRLRCVL